MRLPVAVIAAVLLLYGGTAQAAAPACKAAHCRASWTLKPGSTRTVQSPKTMTAGLLLSFIVYENGRMVHEIASDIERITLGDQHVMAIMESPGDAPFRARLANFSRHRVRVTVEYWQTDLTWPRALTSG